MQSTALPTLSGGTPPIIDAVIVEDTFDNREILKKLLASSSPGLNMQGEAENVGDAYCLIKDRRPDLVFLDIQLGKETSFDLLERLCGEGEINFEIIFITGHGSYENVTRAIEFSALDFITKPIEEDKLLKAVEKAAKRIALRQHNLQIALLLEHLKQSPGEYPRIALNLLKGVVELVAISEIVWLEADGVMTYVHLRDGTRLNAVKHLGYYARLLCAEDDFFQISNDTVVNLKHVKRYHHSELTVTLLNQGILKASRRRGQDFRRFLGDHGRYHGLSDSKGLLEGMWEKF